MSKKEQELFDEIEDRVAEFRKDRTFSRGRLYTVAIANGFYLENEVFTDPDDSDRIIMDLTLCRNGFPFKRRWLTYSAPSDTPLEEIYDTMAFSIVEGLCCVDAYWELLWDLLYDGEVVDQCPCCGMPTIGKPIPDSDQHGDLHLLQ